MDADCVGPRMDTNQEKFFIRVHPWMFVFIRVSNSPSRSATLRQPDFVALAQAPGTPLDVEYSKCRASPGWTIGWMAWAGLGGGMGHGPCHDGEHGPGPGGKPQDVK